MAELLFSDHQNKEIRPVIILSRNNYNKNYDDVIVCGITTNSTHSLHMNISDSDLKKGTLHPGSGIRSDLIARMMKADLQFRVGKITDDFHKKIVSKIVELIE